MTAETNYVVLRHISDNGWEVVQNVAARDSNTAVKAAAEDGGVFVAVPARSWQPVKATSKVQTTVVLEDA